MTNLTQRVTLVTGSTKGIGSAIAEAFVQKGTAVNGSALGVEGCIIRSL